MIWFFNRLAFTGGHMPKDAGSMPSLYEIARLREEVAGWKRTALAMRDEAIIAARTGVSRTRAIQELYFKAAMAGEFVPREQGDAQD